MEAVGQGAQSQGTFALAKFLFREKSSQSKTVEAAAQFNYWHGSWRLDNFSYGEFPNRVGVDVNR